jgi:hypothetical protein
MTNSCAMSASRTSSAAPRKVKRQAAESSLAKIFGAEGLQPLAIPIAEEEQYADWKGCCWREGIDMRRLASLVRRFFGPRLRHMVDHDPSLPFAPEEFSRLIRSGRREDMKLLAEGLACRSIRQRAKFRTTH